MPELDSAFRFARMHGEIEKRLKPRDAFSHLRAGEFMPAYFRQVPNITAKARCPADGDARIASIDVGDIAEIAARCSTGSGHEGKDLSLTGRSTDHDGGGGETFRAAGKAIRYVNVRRKRRGKPACRWNAAYLADALFELFGERRNGKEAQVWPDAELLLDVADII